jgi:hypothetical protein
MPHVGPEHVPCACTDLLNMGQGPAIALTGQWHRCDSILGPVGQCPAAEGRDGPAEGLFKDPERWADKLVNTAQLLGQDNKKKSEKNLMTSWRRSTATRILSQKLVKTLLAPKEHNSTHEIIIEANNAAHWSASKKWKLQRSLGFLPTIGQNRAAW